MHEVHKRQRIDASQTLDRQKFERVMKVQESVVENEEENKEGDLGEMAGPSLDLFFAQPEE